ncbi:MAG TPA: hypothetical protein VMG98_14155 [Verrucomicrobiae bacterium]|nr:hypothetical protein [Verrucomicrobiae bacterium]
MAADFKCGFQVIPIAKLPDARTPRLEFFDPSSNTFVVVQGIPDSGAITALQLPSGRFVRSKLPRNVVPADVGNGFVLLSNGVVLDEWLRKVAQVGGAIAITSRGCVLKVGLNGIAGQHSFLRRGLCNKAQFRWPSGFNPAPESGGIWAVSADHRDVALIDYGGLRHVWNFKAAADNWPLRTNPGNIQSFRSLGPNAVIGGIEAIARVRGDRRSLVIHAKSGLGVLDAVLRTDGLVVFGATDAQGRAFLGIDSDRPKSDYTTAIDWTRIDVAHFVNGPKDSVLVEGLGGIVYKVTPTCLK